MASYPTNRPRIEVLNATPLNSMPYADPRVSYGDNNVSRIQEEKERVASTKPALIFLPCQPPEEEWNNLLSTPKSGIGLTGSAASGLSGPVLGKTDISESEDSYVLRVSLPGVAREDFTCNCDPTGKILIKGVTTTGEKIVYKSYIKFEMQPQHLCSPGHFSITFKLPGPVDPQYLTTHFGTDGVFECKVRKKL